MPSSGDYGYSNSCIIIINVVCKKTNKSNVVPLSRTFPAASLARLRRLSTHPWCFKKRGLNLMKKIKNMLFQLQ